MRDNITFKITINNWDKHNPGHKKGYSYFRFHSGFFSDPSIANLSKKEIVFYIYLMCLVCDKNDAFLSLNCRFLPHFLRISITNASKMLDRLQENQLLTYEKVGVNRIEKNRIEKKILKENSDRSANAIADTVFVDKKKKPVFDFEAVYAKYPRKIGKTQGIKKLTSTITDQKDFDALVLAVENYSRHVYNEKTPSKYIKHFSTFVSGWRDWVELDVPRRTGWEHIDGEGV